MKGGSLRILFAFQRKETLSQILKILFRGGGGLLLLLTFAFQRKITLSLILKFWIRVSLCVGGVFASRSSSFHLFPFHKFLGGLTLFFEYIFFIPQFPGGGQRLFLVALRCIFCYSANSRGRGSIGPSPPLPVYVLSKCTI